MQPMVMKYDVEADFFLLTTCNFRCDYCFLSTEKLGAKIPHYATNEQWDGAFQATGKTWLLHLTGGEPFVYPGFVDLCRRLQERHFLSINTNLSHTTVDGFEQAVDPGRVHFINAALHFEERQHRMGPDTFIGRARKLRAAGFNMILSVVMTPPMVTGFRALSELFTLHGLSLVPKVLRGTYKGVKYPEGYSPTHKALIRGHLLEAQRRYADVLARMGEAPTIDVFSDERFVEGNPKYRGRLCGSGHNFVRIDPNGDVKRCSTRQSLGNMLRRDVQLFDSPRPCDTDYCPYFCEKYTSPQFRGKPATELPMVSAKS